MLEFFIKTRICRRKPVYLMPKPWEGFVCYDAERNSTIVMLMPFNLVGALFCTIYLLIHRANVEQQIKIQEKIKKQLNNKQ